jgi:glycosyltransferase involved in cell wall biosynthesis
MIYVLNVDVHNRQPNGGTKQLHRLVDVLNEIGREAVLVNCLPGFRMGWFENTTPVKWIVDVVFEDGDVLVLPEMIQMWPHLETLSKATKVVYNQNYWFTFNLFCDWENSMPVQYDRIRQFYFEDVSHILACSAYNQSFLEFMFPHLDVHRIRYSFDRGPFGYEAARKKQLCYMTRRRSSEAERLLEMLNTRGSLMGWDVVRIENMNEVQVADVMRDSAIFLSMSHRDGFGMPPVEAMACGCVVVGFAGVGGEEFFGHDFSVQAKEDDLLDFGRKLVPFLGMDLSMLEKLGRRASDYAVSEYSSARERESIRMAFERMGV